jgi:hypothetical protein
MPFTDMFVLGEDGFTAIQVQAIYALSAIVLHVIVYNCTARLEHATRCFTRVCFSLSLSYSCSHLRSGLSVLDGTVFSVLMYTLSYHCLPAEVLILCG